MIGSSVRWDGDIDDASANEFAAGQSILFEGVAFFVDPDDPKVLHAAIALRQNEPELVQRSVREVNRLFAEFALLRSDLSDLFHGRRMEIRFLDTYRDYASEKTARQTVQISW